LSATTQTHSSRRRHDERHPPYAGRPLRRAARLPVEPNYTTIDAGDSSGATLRVHYVDEQPAQEGVPGTVLLLHGEPTWSYLYRTLSVPFLYAHAEGDYGVGDGRTMLREGIPGAREVVIMNAGHFIQEDCVPELVTAIDQFIRSTPATETVR
jgi:pimeloyl-ACP methyl ester carboxylesterase